MIKSWRYIGFCALLLAGFHVGFSQQIEPKQDINIDDLGNVSDEFQESFFEALKQKAITNYDKAIESLEKCIAINDKELILYEELGKNYLKLKKYNKAILNFNKVLEVKTNDRYTLELLYEVYFEQRKYKESIEIVEKLVFFDPIFNEQLANLYFIDQRYDDALIVVDQLISDLGTDKYREKLRKRVLLKISNPNSQISSLEQKIKKSPKEEKNYLNLIYLYSQNNKPNKAYTTAKELLANNPKSELVHLALYKFYLDDNKVDKAISSMKIALATDQLDADAKYKVVNDFLTFVNVNPSYEDRLVEVTKMLSSDISDSKVFTEIGSYFYKKDKKELALNFYERGIKENSNDFEILKRILLLQLDLKRFEKAKLGSELAIEMFPSQPILYLVSGVALISLDKNDEAIETLMTGLDYIIDDENMESDFYQQISNAYAKVGNEIKATDYKEKAFQLKKKS